MEVKDNLFENDDFYEDDDFYESGDEYEGVSINDIPIPGSSSEYKEDVDYKKGEVNLNKESSTSFSLVVEDDEDDVIGTNNSSTSSSDDVLSQEEQLRYFSDKVMSALVGNKSINKYAISKLISFTNPRLFRDENYILFSILYNFRDVIKNMSIDSEFIFLHLDTNRKLIEESKEYIDIHSYGEVDGSEIVGYISGVVKHFNRLCSMEDMSESEFNLYFEKYLIVFKSVESQKVFAKSNLILTEGVKVGRKFYSGFEDSYNYSRRALADIDGLVNTNQGTGFTSMREILAEEKDEGKNPVKIADFDKLEKLNEHYGGIYTGTFYQVLAPAKAGKSKFCARICHTASVKYGTNVTVWAHEGGNVAWTAQMRAIHFDYTYNEGASVTERKYGVTQDSILKGSLDDTLKDLEVSSKVDLLANTNYGNVDYIDRPFNVETFIEDIDTSVKSNNSKIVIIDYLQLIGSENSRLSERERISRAYQDLLNYCRKNNVAVLTPAQYKQDVIDSMVSKGDTSSAEMRTAGGGSAEVLRTPDITFAFWASTKDLQNNKMKVLSMPCRFNKAYPEIPCHIDLGTCNFISIDK